MKQVNRVISTYSADVFGAASALFELGGMTVIHDPSGCNSTYTTHDEPRWFNSKTLLYISALTEREAILGDDRRFIEDVTKTALLQKPRFIALLSAQMPAMLGTDMKGIAKIVEKNTNIKTFALETSSMRDYSTGINMALEKIAKIITENEKEISPKNREGVNLLGVTPLDFGVNGTDKSMINFFENNGFPVISVFAMNYSLDELKKADKAAVNIVVTYGGIGAARVMEKAWGIPYITGFPVGKTGENIIKMLRGEKYGAAYKNNQNLKENKKIYLIYESVMAASLATALEREANNKITVINATSTEKNLMREGDEIFTGESELEEKLKRADLVLADPMYRAITGDAPFIELPHTAFSGRTYRRETQNLIEDFTKTAEKIKKSASL